MGVADIEDDDFLSRLSGFKRFSGAECGALEDGAEWSRPSGVGVGEEPGRGGGGRGCPVDPGSASPAAAAAAATLFLVPPLNIALNE